jgi:hypothetical protein
MAKSKQHAAWQHAACSMWVRYRNTVKNIFSLQLAVKKKISPPFSVVRHTEFGHRDHPDI